MKALIATLRAGKTDQCQLSLVFGFDVPVEFSLVGEGMSVFLSGYFQPGPEDEDMDEEGDFGEDEEDEEDGEDRAALYRQMAMGMNGGGGEDSDDDDDDDEEEEEEEGRVQQLDDSEEDDEEDSEDEALDAQFINKMISKNKAPAGKGPVDKVVARLAASEAPAKKVKHEDAAKGKGQGQGQGQGQQKNKGDDKKQHKQDKNSKAGDKRKR